MKISYSEYAKKIEVSVLVAEAIFSVLNRNSPQKAIAEVAITTSGGTPNRGNKEYYGGEIPWLKSGELNDGVITRSEEFITEEGLKNSSAKLHPVGTLLLAMYGATAGKTGIINFPASTNQAVCAIFPKEGIEKDYLYWFLRQHRYKFIEISKGGAQPNISQNVIKSTKIPVPEISTQKEVIQILKSIKEKETLQIELIPEEYRTAVSKVFYTKNNVTTIENENSYQLDLLKKLRQQILQDAVQGKLVPQDPNDEPASKLVERIKAEKEKLVREKKIKKEKPLTPIKPEEIPFEIPVNWVWCKLGDIVCIGGGKRIPSGHSLSRNPTPFVYIRVSDMKNGTVDDSDLHYLKEETFNILKSYRIFISDLYMTIVGATIGKCGLIPSRFDGMVLTENAVKVTPFQVSKEFLRFAFDSPFLQNQFIDKTKKVGVEKMAIIRFKNSLIALPPFKEQSRIICKVEQLMTLCDELEQSIQQNQKYTQELLQVALKEALEQKN